MNMFKPVKATTVEEYLASLPEDRKEPFLFLHDLIQKTAPTLKPHFAYNMLGYGSMKYLDSKKKVIDWPIVSLANQKNYISLYICATEGNEYIAEKNKDRLGKVNVGKSCIQIKKIEDVHVDVLKEVLKRAEKSPGLVGVGAVTVE
jgi:hypothetical protein